MQHVPRSQLCLNTLSRWLPLTFVTLVTLCHMLSLVCSNSPLLPMSHSLVCSPTETETCDCPTPALTACTWAPGPGGRGAPMTHSAHHPGKSLVNYTWYRSMLVTHLYRKPSLNSFSTVSSSHEEYVNAQRRRWWSTELRFWFNSPSLPLSAGYTNKSCRVIWDHREFNSLTFFAQMM